MRLHLDTNKFLSTPSARRATISGTDTNLGDKFLSTPSARRATWSFVLGAYNADISIHALREEGDYASRSLSLSVILFLSTPSARRATRKGPVYLHCL